MSRWQPTRAGITNVWRYFDEVFTFDHGRLLLRGPNGSGKSKALEVLLPFLLDANLSPSRLSTFGTTARTMHWNLMGEGASGRTRIGFVWLEFGRDTETVTIGARLQATRETTRVEPVYFITHLSIPDELRLVAADGSPLSVAALEEAVRGNGDVYRKAQEYRTAVRERLFPAMGAERYDTLVQALLQLRRPKLSEHLDPEALSGLLSSALPPVDAEQIRELAEGFERLDQQRAQLVHLSQQEKAARDLSNAVAAYSRGVIRARATALTQATTNLDNASAAVRHGEEQRDDEQKRADAATKQEGSAKALCDELRGSKQALERSDAYAEGRNLDDLRRRAADARSLADRTAHDAEHAGRRAESSRANADADARSAAEHQRGLAQHIDDIRAAALTLAISGQGEQVEPPPAEPLFEPEGLEAAERWSVAADAALVGVAVRARARRGQVIDALGLLNAHGRAIDERDRRETAVDQATNRVDEASQALRDANQALQRELAAHEVAVLAWADSLEALSLDRAVVEARLGVVHCALDGGSPEDADENALRELAGSAVAAIRQEDGRRQGELAVQRRTLEDRRAATTAERERLAAARFAEPERSRWRDAPATRGAPLWRLVDARPDAPADQIVAIEAGLQAAGLLDAWVLPDGSVEVPGNDILLAPGSNPDPAPHGTLLELLVPDPGESDVQGEVIARILGSIGLIRPEAHDAAGPPPSEHGCGREAVWVATDGRWQLGVQHGRWHKPHAAYLGATARERHRQAQLAELTATIANLDQQLQDLDGEHDQLAAHIHKATEEAAALPPEAEVRKAAGVVAGAAGRVATFEHLRSEALTARAAAELAANACWTRFETEIGRSKLPAHRDALNTLASEIESLSTTTETARRLVPGFVGAASRAVRANRSANDDTQEWAALRTRAGTDDSAARTLAAELEALDATKGAEYREVVARIAELEAAITMHEAVQTKAHSALRAAEKKVVELQERTRNAERDREVAVQRRDHAQEDFAWSTGTLLAEDAGLGRRAELDGDRVRPTLDLARQVLRDLGSDATALAELNTRMTQQVRASEAVLADRAFVELTPERDVMIASAMHGGRRMPVRSLRDAVADERARTEQEITEAQDALFRRILTGDTRRHLSSRIRDAGDIVADMNARLGEVHTSSDVRVRLVWEVRKDEGALLARARELLLTAPERLTEDDERALVDFLGDRISRAREADDGLPWAQQLAKVFDYTAWHQFRVQMKRGDAGEWKLLTKQVHSALSGGEKAIALHLPLFAALAALYATTPQAPRFILLDEVFVGIDTANRGQIFGLLTDLDLDVFLTSDHEWAAYPQVDGIAIHALAADDGDDAVTSTRFVWTGRELVEDPFESGVLL